MAPPSSQDEALSRYSASGEAIALYLQKYIVYRKRKISFADGSFKGLIELIVKHKDEKYMLALSEPHKPELPETLSTLKINFTPAILARTVAADVDNVDIKSYDMLLLYSPWDIMTITEKFGTESLPVIATFGEGTLRKAIESGIEVRANAPTPAAPSLAKAVDIFCTKIAKGEEVLPVQLEEDSAKEEFIRNQQSKLAKKSRSRAKSV